MSDSLLDWQEGRSIDPRGRKKVLLAAGVYSQTGDAERHLGPFSRFLQRSHGFQPGDFLEATYRGRWDAAGWRPALYRQADAEASLSDSTAHVVRLLKWYDARLPIDLELHLVGYSLGGVLLFRAAQTLLDSEPARWQLRLRSLVTISSPHFGCDLGVEGDLLGLFGLGALLPGGQAGRELCALGSESEHRSAVERQADQLRRLGLRLLTLADENDVVVTPADAVIAPPDQRGYFTLSSSRSSVSAARAEAALGHGPILDDPKAWTMMARVIGPQEPRGRTATGAIAL
jgi:hypothetical protein